MSTVLVRRSALPPSSPTSTTSDAPRGDRMSVRMKEVASRAGVSVKTV